jgi:hypothetical protein
VGLLTVLADAGRVHDALRGYREVVDYFARTGNWTGTTLRKVADVLRRLGDNEPATVLDAAAEQAWSNAAVAPRGNRVVVRGAGNAVGERSGAGPVRGPPDPSPLYSPRRRASRPPGSSSGPILRERARSALSPR